MSAQRPWQPISLACLAENHSACSGTHELHDDVCGCDCHRHWDRTAITVAPVAPAMRATA